ncbi:histidine phosphotransferase family protein [Siccirubricoccus phaeus]|uniref:histidine phosphotransferase family protein n=1 Tax=Siccirubricoccus phaeus TaxID=2595053 RepID=UPI0011F2866E|nr:histidine phosphotransferase family protein [Siccirubricoccus phaeus]
MSAASRLSRLVAARLCHDLGGVVGSLSGTLDMLSQGDAELLALSRESATALRLRLRLYGAAWGMGSGTLDAPAIGELLLGAPAFPRVQFALAGLSVAGPVPAELVPLVLNAALLGAEALPRGGTVHVAGDAAAGFTILPEGRSVAWPAALLRLLADDDLDAAMAEGPRRMVVPLLAVLAAAEGYALSLALGVGPAPPLVLAKG